MIFLLPFLDKGFIWLPSFDEGLLIKVFFYLLWWGLHYLFLIKVFVCFSFFGWRFLMIFLLPFLIKVLYGLSLMGVFW